MKQDENIELDPGAASLILTLHKGRLIVQHGTESAHLLYEGDLPVGGWNKLCKSITESTINGHGVLAD